jgi:hypothetical protein
VVDLTVHYPRSTLVVDDQVTINGIVVVHDTPTGINILSITISFENALSSPVIQTDGITNGSKLVFRPMNRTNGFAAKSTTCTWAVEGTYHALMEYLWENATGQYRSSTMQSPNMAITVYPKAELAQIETNNASMIVTVAFYGLTVIGTFSLVLSLWDRQPSTQESKGNSENRDKRTDVEDKGENAETSAKKENSKQQSNHTET